MKILIAVAIAVLALVAPLICWTVWQTAFAPPPWCYIPVLATGAIGLIVAAVLR